MHSNNMFRTQLILPNHAFNYLYLIRSVFFLFIASLFFFKQPLQAQGTWIPLSQPNFDICAGVMLLLSDGTVMAKTQLNDVDADNISAGWTILTPDQFGSYIDGSWNSATSMADSRLYFSSRMLRDGRLYVAGGEYGTGGQTSELYDPVTGTWQAGPVSNFKILDANSEMLPDGRVLQGLVASPFNKNKFYNPQTNLYSTAPSSFGNHDEATWLLLKDSSILLVDNYTYNSERYIPSINAWIHDSILPVQIYDSAGRETGAAFLLPDGRAFFMGATSKTAFYTPSGNLSKGIWTAGPDIPDSLCAMDAAASMMPNGKILCAFSPIPTDSNIFIPPTYFYEFDYQTNLFTPIMAPDGNVAMYVPCYYTNMLNLPDGSVLFANQDDFQYYIYQPSGPQLAIGTPTINKVEQIDCDHYRITGTLFNGISEGSCYGDDWQMATNYPMVSLKAGSMIYYARTSDWNSNGVQRWGLNDTAYFSLPAGMPSGSYTLQLSSNGIISTPYGFNTCAVGIEETHEFTFSIFPNPAINAIAIQSTDPLDELIITDILGQVVLHKMSPSKSISVSALHDGIYFVTVKSDHKSGTQKVVIKH